MSSKTSSQTKRIHKPTNSRTFRSKRIDKAKRASQSKRLQGINELRQIHETSQVSQIPETKKVQRLKVKILAVIWGHGSLTQTAFKNKFNERIKLNMFGLGVSGCSTWLNKAKANYINQSLLSGQILDKVLLTKLNNAEIAWDAVYKFEPTTTTAITSLGNTHSLYTTIKDFGRGEKNRSDKSFSGEHNPRAVEIYPAGMEDKITKGPVLRIYQIMVTDELGEILQHQISPIDIILPNYSRLANIQEEIIHFVHNLTVYPSSSKFEIPAGTLHDIELDLFDTSCNYTEKEPVMAYLENKTIRKLASQGKIRKYTSNPNRVKHPLPPAKPEEKK
jgi:hypothetical protein